MTNNKKIIEKFMDGYRNNDHEKVLSCLTADIVWETPGIFHLTGKEAFYKNIGSKAFVGKPTINIIHMIEENNIVVAEGFGRVKKRLGGSINLMFCDVFIMQDEKIKHLTSYLADIKE